MGSSKVTKDDVLPPSNRTTRSNSSSLVLPNLIPPRTSSNTGILHPSSSSSGAAAHLHRHSHNPISSSNHASGGPRVLLSEASWLGSSSTSASASASSSGKKGKQPVREVHFGLPFQTVKKSGRNTASIMQHQIHPTGTPEVKRYQEENFTARVDWSEEKEKVVRGPFDYVISHPGKDFRAQVIGAFNLWLKVPPAKLDIITSVVAMLHESSLLVDDVQDNSELRRGFPVAHSIFGVAQTINSANYVYFCALQELLKLGNPATLSVFADELVNLHRGQGMDLFWRDTLTCPTEEDYLEMVGNKTGGLFRLGIRLMQAESQSGIDCVPLIDLLGLIFQIRDDYMNLASDEYSQNKGMCEDLTEGKFSFPILHAIRAEPSNLQLINILKQKTTDTQIKRYAVTLMESKGSFQYTREVVSTLLERARKLVDELDQGSGKAAGIHKILDKMIISAE